MAASLPSARAGLLAVAVALQNLRPDGFLHRFNRGLELAEVAAGQFVWLVAISLTQWRDHIGLRPPVELLHEARFLLFGHMFVPFGKLECIGSGQLALLATSRSPAAGCYAVS